MKLLIFHDIYTYLLFLDWVSVHQPWTVSCSGKCGVIDKYQLIVQQQQGCPWGLQGFSPADQGGGIILGGGDVFISNAHVYWRPKCVHP